MADNDFFRQQQAAMERMREMNARSQFKNNNRNHKMPPTPSFVRLNGEEKKETAKNNPTEQKPKEQTGQKNSGSSFDLGGLGIPFLDSLKTDSDISLILGLMLIFLSEKSDKLLLMALVYILM
ncbi:MAG: hypothetical protein IJ470_03035 [Clostridia bacterium]|nr:hypothetical protein [Clostridia bacterium]